MGGRRPEIVGGFLVPETVAMQKTINAKTQRGKDAENLKDLAPRFLESPLGELSQGPGPAHVGSYQPCVFASLRLSVEFLLNSPG